jgi:hypothetical protein
MRIWVCRGSSTRGYRVYSTLAFWYDMLIVCRYFSYVQMDVLPGHRKSMQQHPVDGICGIDKLMTKFDRSGPFLLTS